MKKILITVFISMCVLSLYAQQSVTGIVSDISGEPLQGASVSVKGTTKGVVTDQNGQYSIQVTNDEAVLSFSFVGYISQDIATGGRLQINVTLDESSQEIGEVVIVGYGVQKKTHLLGSVTQVQAKEIEKISTGRMTNALAGRMSGVSIAQSSGGRPGNTSEIIVRARGTWNSTSPLFVIDGVARDQRAFDNLDPSQVETFSVLKDAAAATIYGSRAANGVVLVTTKKGKTGKPIISYSGSYGVGSFTKVPERETMEQRFAMINDHIIEFGDTYYQQNARPNIYANGRDASGGYISTQVMTDDEMKMYRDRGAVDMLKEAYSTPVTSNHSLNVSGGTDNVRYFVGASFYDEKGVFKTLQYDKYNIRSSVEANLNKYWTAGLDVSATWARDKMPVGATNSEYNRGNDKLRWLWGTFMRGTTLLRPKIDGKYTNPNVGNWGSTNPVAIAEGAAGDISKTNWDTEYTASLKWDAPWIQGLSAKGSFNQRWRHEFNKTWSTPYQQYNVTMKGTNGHFYSDEISGVAGTHGGNAGKPALYETSTRWDDYQLNLMLTYDRSFGKHEVSALLGYEQAQELSDDIGASKLYYTLNKPYFNWGPADVDNAGNAGNNYGVYGGASESARLSYLGRLSYTFANKYLAEVSFRRDASIKFHPDHRWGFFPSGSLAWRIGEESFIKENFTWLHNMKVRGSIGLTGNDGGSDMAAWQWQDKMNPNVGGYYWGGSSNTQGVALGSLANPFVTWEKSLNYNAGLEMGFLKNMFTFGFEYFFRHTYDILGSQTADIPDTFGGTLATSNYGIVDSYGIEIEVGFNKQIGKDISLWAKGNFGWAANKLKKYAESGVAAHLSRVGKNWDRRVGYISDGIIHSMEELGNNRYLIRTSTGHEYNVPGNGYLQHGMGDRNDINRVDFLAMRPGLIFYPDMGSVSGTDANGNPIYSDLKDDKVTGDPADRRWIIDHYNPPYSYGLLLGGSWKGLSLEIFFNGFAGHQTFLTMDGIGGDGTINDTSFAFWAEDHYSTFNNPDGMMPAPTNWWGLNVRGWDNAHEENNPSFWVRNASFIRLKNITLSYDLPKSLLSKIGVEGLNVFLTGDNVALLYNPLKVADPELAGSFNALSPSQGNSPESPLVAFPLMRTWTIGLNLTF